MESNEPESAAPENPPEQNEQDPHPEEEQAPQASSATPSSLLANPPPPTSSQNNNIINDSVSFDDPMFPYVPSFASKSRKEKELLFLRAFEEQTLFIRNKELKCVNSPVSSLLEPEDIQKIIDTRQSYHESYENSLSRKAITRKVTESSSNPAPRVEVETTPTFNTLLNVHFESQFSLLEKFKTLVSQIITRNRATKRTQNLTQYLINQTNNAVKSLQDKQNEKVMLTANSLLSLKIECCRTEEKFAEPYQLPLPEEPEFNIELHNVEKPFTFYVPGLVERYQLTPFTRTDVTSYVAAPIAPPETFPIVREEQPVREQTVPSLDLTDETTKEVINQEVQPPVQSGPLQMPKVVHHPREIRYYDFDPSYNLRPQPIELPELPDEIGKASILALPLSEYEKMSLSGKSKAPFAPFEFSGITKFMCSGLTPMTAADPVDLRELEADDDIDGIDITPKVRPITDFITKPLNTKNKSHALQEAVTEGQTQWKERQKKGVSELIEKMKNLNNLMKDKTLNLPMNDLLEYMKL
ncbi:hypothetical protein TRFO_06640 [Tritrichomonas foetus]|uniref:Uncharacterized protein n=1 Tax=Tritrichomonas foetus TaxID=1144522 RepID=A0A1J4JWA0_9EUKA|nr:hypothetical protein TRFO_06640 [Tritrichomonas foetus]|eukprot:OHT03417.1 hypothetical protein TRFO_06640 [Tritrichomonas foetus]